RGSEYSESCWPSRYRGFRRDFALPTERASGSSRDLTRGSWLGGFREQLRHVVTRSLDATETVGDRSRGYGGGIPRMPDDLAPWHRRNGSPLPAQARE